MLTPITPQREPEDSNNGFDVAVMRGQAGCGLSSVCAKLIDQVQQAAADSKDGGAVPSVLYYFRRPERNNLGPDTYLVSEIRGQDPFRAKDEFQVGLAKLPRVLMQEASKAGKSYLVVIDGLNVPEVAALLSGCGDTKQSLSSQRDAGGLKLLVTLADTHTSDVSH